MKLILLATSSLVLSACTEMPMVETQSVFASPRLGLQSFQSSPLTIHDPRFADPHFYADDDAALQRALGFQ